MTTTNTLEKFADFATRHIKPGKTSGLVAMESDKLPKVENLCLVHAKGDCMDTATAPMRIKNGDKLLISPCGDICQVVGKIAVIGIKGALYVKHIIAVDFEAGKVTFKQYIPTLTISVNISEIEQLFIVHSVYSEEYILNHICTTNEKD